MVVGNQRRMSTARGGCAMAIDRVSSALPAKTQKAPGGSVMAAPKIARPAAQTVTSRRAPKRVASRAPGIDAMPNASTATEVMEPVAR